MLSHTPIPCLDIKQQNQQVKKEVFQLFEKVYDNTAFSGGPFVEEFEKHFSRFIGTRHAVGVNNGTSALHLALLCLGIGPGDEVILPANTFIATAWSISYTGATPVFADCLPDTWEIDPASVRKHITPKTKAVIGVHLYGQPFDIDEISRICKEHNLHLLEDAAQAHGAEYKGVKVGGFGEMACFSFYPGKNLGACGEGGAVVTNNEQYYRHLQSLRNHGSTERYYHNELGYNMRMGGLEGASLTVKLKYLEGWNNRRRQIASMYFEGIRNPKIKMQHQPDFSKSIYHLFVITTDNRQELIRYLNNQNIFPGLHYPVPCHLQSAYKHLNYKRGDFVNSEYLAEHCLSLPMFSELTDSEIERTITSLNKY